MKPADWVMIHNLAHKAAAMPDGTDFWTSHSILKAMKEKAMEYAKQVEATREEYTLRMWAASSGNQRLDPPMGSLGISAESNL